MQQDNCQYCKLSPTNPLRVKWSPCQQNKPRTELPSVSCVALPLCYIDRQSVFPALPMFSQRSLLVFGLGFLLTQLASGQTIAPSVQPVPEATAAVPVETPARSTPPAAPPSPAGPQITFNSVYVDGPYIAMTFDDGPHGTLTPKLLDLLAARKIKATFFVVGQCAAEFPPSWREPRGRVTKSPTTPGHTRILARCPTKL